MALSICKPPEPLSFTGNAARNWQDFEEQLTWFLAGTESSENPTQLGSESCSLTLERKHARFTKHFPGQ